MTAFAIVPGRRYAVRQPRGMVRQMEAVSTPAGGKVQLRLIGHHHPAEHDLGDVLFPWQGFREARRGVPAASRRLLEAFDNAGLQLFPYGRESRLVIACTMTVEQASSLIAAITGDDRLAVAELPVLTAADIVEGRVYAVRMGNGTIVFRKVTKVLADKNRVVVDRYHGPAPDGAVPAGYVVCDAETMRDRKRETPIVAAALEKTLAEHDVQAQRVIDHHGQAKIHLHLTVQGAHTLSDLLAAEDASDPLAELFTADAA